MEKQYSKETVSTIADEIRLKYGSVFPVNVIEIANNLGLQVYTYNETNPNISGMLDPKNKKIYVSRNDLYLRQKFSVAHEIGHWVLDHRGISPDGDKFEISYRNVMTAQDIKEVRANHFAACLLMPEKETKEAWELNNYDLDNTARFLVVSRLALSIRLDNLGLLNE